MNKLTAYSVTLIFALAALLSACTSAQQPAVIIPVDNETVAKPIVAPPVIKGIAGSVEWAPGSQGPLTCIAADPHGYKLTYKWTAADGTIDGAGRQVTWTAPKTTGEYTVTVEVTNEAGAVATFSRPISVVSNPLRNEVQDETIYLKFPLPSQGPVTASKQVLVNTISEIQCVFPNTDQKVITVVWSAPVGKLLGEGIEDGAASHVGWLSPGVPGQYSVNVQVSDKLGHTATGSVSFDVVPIQ